MNIDEAKLFVGGISRETSEETLASTVSFRILLLRRTKSLNFQEDLVLLFSLILLLLLGLFKIIMLFLGERSVFCSFLVLINYEC
jgi:hypothetical protein